MQCLALTRTMRRTYETPFHEPAHAYRWSSDFIDGVELHFGKNAVAHIELMVEEVLEQLVHDLPNEVCDQVCYFKFGYAYVLFRIPEDEDDIIDVIDFVAADPIELTEGGYVH